MHELDDVVRRTFGARTVRVVEDAEAEGATTLVVALPHGGFVVVELDAPPADREAVRERLAALMATFAQTAASARPARPAPAARLRELLVDLTERAGAIDVAILDAKAPVVWGTARADADALLPEAEVVHVDWKAHRRADPPPGTSEPAWPLQRRAVREVRALPQMAELARGGHLARDVREPAFGWIARSFAGVYVAVLVFDRAWDELQAKPALLQALPAIETALLSLPPRDPVGGAAAMGRPRRV
jgi:hypothetical protein